jgi:hypothetical protein
MKIIPFPKAGQARPSMRGAASRDDAWVGRIDHTLGTLMNRLGVPGAVRDIHLKDALTGYEIEVETGILYTRISLNGRDFYFHRLSGRFGGTDSGCA